MTFFVGFVQVFSHTSARLSKWSPDIQKQNTQWHPQTKSSACCSPGVRSHSPILLQKSHKRCSVPCLATVPATPYHPLSRPHWPRSQLLHTRCLVPIGYDLSYAIPAVSPPSATSSATPYQLSRPHCGHELSFTIPAVSSPLRPRAQLYHTSCLVPIGHELSYAIPPTRCPRSFTVPA